MPLVASSPTLDAWCMDASRTHHPSQTALAATLRPRSIAVVGASPRSFAGQIVQRNCADHRFGGLIIPVNGRYAEVAGVPTVASLSDLDTAPDAVVALVGTARVQAIAEEAAAIGAGAVIVPGGGFTDSGGAATDLAASLATPSRRHRHLGRRTELHGRRRPRHVAPCRTSAPFPRTCAAVASLSSRRAAP